jgi:hypothetical protein
MARSLTPARRRKSPVSAERVVIPGVTPHNAAPEPVVRTLPFPNGEPHLVEATIRTAAALRKVRDERQFVADGTPTFRAWCMNKFGERLGAFIEETL